jgi:hypothetical protein
MCCEPHADALLPPQVARMLGEYRALHAARAHDWGHELGIRVRGLAYARWLSPELVFADLNAGFAGEVREALPPELPAGMTVATVDGAGVSLRSGARPYAIGGQPVELAVLVDSRVDGAVGVAVAGQTRQVEGVDLVTLAVPGYTSVPIGGSTVVAGEIVASARLRLRAGAPSRWSVVDSRGVGWFPDGYLRKWDRYGRPMFHGQDIVLDVPAVPLTVTCRRGLEFGADQAAVVPPAGGTTLVELEPPRRFDPAAAGWYGGDLHVHMNYSGDLVCAPDDAARMQRGEGLHLMNLVAGNFTATRVYDREAFEATAGQDLPWSRESSVARFGVEYRNDLLGHFHGLGLTAAPAVYHTGHEGSDQPYDWPPNSTAAAEFRDQGAAVGYTHPVMGPLPDGTAAGAFTRARSVEARELVADAALGLVDSMDLLGPNDTEATVTLYHHLLNCGLRLAATAGTDTWLSFARASIVSNPPGWARVYADLRGAPLSVGAFADAVRAGRTLATNAPWLTLSVAGHGPGDTLAAAARDRVRVTATVAGPGVREIELVGPHGTVAKRELADEGDDGRLAVEVEVAASMWLAAVARGPEHPACLGYGVFAHTSPGYVSVDGAPVNVPASARWLLDWLDRLETLLRSEGCFADDAQRAATLAVIEQARPYYLDRA